MSGVPVTVADIKDRLVGLDKWFRAAELSKAKYGEAKITDMIPTWVRKFEREMQFRLYPVQVVSAPDGAYNPNPPLPNTPPVIIEQGYDYYEAYSNEYFVTTFRERPVRTVQRLRFMENGRNLVFQCPPEWFSLDGRSGRFWMLPYYGAAALEASAQTLVTFGPGYWPSYIPNFLFFDYVAGLPDGWKDNREYADVQLMVAKFCALETLKDISNAVGAGQSGKQISADGASQSLNYDRFMSTKQELNDDINEWKADFVAQETPLMLGAV